jgi:hypothetical protein
MSRVSLPFKVECKSTYPFYETIAAFDCEPAARAYAHNCAEANEAFTYRVTKRGKVLANGQATGHH